MARRIPEDRFARLVEVATQVFIERGYRLTQMGDVATALGVAKGTLYGYVESKEALFELCLRHAATREPIEVPPVLPWPTPKKGALRRILSEQLLRRGTLPELEAALARERAPDIRVELDAVIREYYTLNETYAVAIKLVDRAFGHPDISDAWQTRGRKEPRSRFETWLEARMRAGQVRPFPDPRLPARFIVESVATWAMHIRWDVSPQVFDEKAARDNVIEFLVRGLVADRIQE